MKRKLGRFYITRTLLEDIVQNANHRVTASWCALFGKVIVIATNQHFICDRIEYTAYCEEFDECERGSVVPVYEVQFSTGYEFFGGQPVTTYDVTFKRSAA